MQGVHRLAECKGASGVFEVLRGGFGTGWSGGSDMMNFWIHVGSECGWVQHCSLIGGFHQVSQGVGRCEICLKEDVRLCCVASVLTGDERTRIERSREEAFEAGKAEMRRRQEGRRAKAKKHRSEPKADETGVPKGAPHP